MRPYRSGLSEMLKRCIDLEERRRGLHDGPFLWELIDRTRVHPIVQVAIAQADGAPAYEEMLGVPVEAPSIEELLRV